MKLRLALQNVAALDNGSPVKMEVEKGRLVIGRAPSCDWTLPDPSRYISSTHAEIAFEGSRYVLTDKSTNGVFLNGSETRMAAPHTLVDGDVIGIGDFRIRAEVDDDAELAMAQELFSRRAALAKKGPPRTHAPAAPAPEPADPPRTAFEDIAAKGALDWSRAGFAARARAAAEDQPVDTALSEGSAVWKAFVSGAGVNPTDLKAGPAQTLSAAGGVLKDLVAGLIALLEARTRAKTALGAASTHLELEGNNPLKFARTPEKALSQLLSPVERGYMGSHRAIEDAFQDLEAHESATFTAMQAALASTLKRFSPDSIRERAEKTGLMLKIMPGARDATLWQAYEKEFSGVAQESDKAFVEVFAREFRIAYEREAQRLKGK